MIAARSSAFKAGRNPRFFYNFLLKCIDKLLKERYIITIRSVAPVNKSLLKGERYEEMDKKMPARSNPTANRRPYPNPCSDCH